jgi:hypothetical protein
LATEHFLRSARLLSDEAGGDLVKALVLRAVVAANISHIDQQAEASARYAALDRVPPDAMRRPVSVLALAGSLGLPYETTRRRVAGLIREGRCVRVKGGIVAPSETLCRPAAEQAALANLLNARRFVRALKHAGVPLD